MNEEFSKKTAKPFLLTGTSLSINSKSSDYLRHSRAQSLSNCSSGMNSPTVTSSRSDKSGNGSESHGNPYLLPHKDTTWLEKSNHPEVNTSIDEYWLGFPIHTKPEKKMHDKSSVLHMKSLSVRSNSPSNYSTSEKPSGRTGADSLNEFIELENTIQREELTKNIKTSASRISDRDAALKIQRWYRRVQNEKAKLKTSLHQMMKEKHNQYSSTLAADKDKRKKVSALPPSKKHAISSQGKALRQKAIEELKYLREQRRQEIEKKAKEELANMENSRKNSKKSLPKKPSSNDKVSFPRSTSARTLSTRPVAENLNEPESAEVIATNEETFVDNSFPEPNALSSSVTIARTKTTLADLLSTLQGLEKEHEFASKTSEESDESKPPSNKTLAWLEEVEKQEGPQSQLSSRPSVSRAGSSEQKKDVEDVTSEITRYEDSNIWIPLQMSQRAESVTAYLDGVESSSRRLDDIDQTMVKQEEEIKLALKNINSAAKIADLQQLERASAEITSKCLQQQAELEAKQHTVKMLQKALNQQREYTSKQAKDLERESKKQLDSQRNEYESAIQRHLSFIDQLIEDKKALTEKCEKLVTETRELERKSTNKLKDMEDQHVIEIKKIKEFEQAAEKLRREKWIAEREKRIKEATVKGLEPEIQRLIAQHKDEMRKLKSQHEADVLASDERAAQKYVKMVEDLRQQLSDEKEEACRRERELAKQRYESALTQERMQLQQTEKRLFNEVASEKERIADQNQRQRSELESLQRQLEETHKSALELMRQEYDRAKKDQEEKHSKELRELEERIKIEKQMWEEQYMKKQETWLMTKERELREKVRTERDREIESVISQLESDTRRQREEIEKSAENRVRRLRDKYDSEISELERSDRQTTSKYNETKAKLAETQGELDHSRAILRQKEAELNDLMSDLQKLRDERGRVADIVRQELADRLVAVEEENGRMKAELAEQKARSKAEADRLREDISAAQRSKEVELDEIHQRVKQAIAKKEEVLSQLRQQYEAAVRRADHLEGLLEQQRKKLVGAVASVNQSQTGTARSGLSSHSANSKK